MVTSEPSSIEKVGTLGVPKMLPLILVIQVAGMHGWKNILFVNMRSKVSNALNNTSSTT